MEFEKAPNQSILTDAHVSKIVDTYRNRKNLDKYAHVASIKEIAENDYNLHMPRYLYNFEPEIIENIEAISSELRTTDARIEQLDDIISTLCQELEIVPPLGHNVELLKSYKKGITQMLFSQTLRFKDHQEEYYPDWQEMRLGDVFDWVRTNSLSREYLTNTDGHIQNIHYGDIHKNFKANFKQDNEIVPFISKSAKFKQPSKEEFCRLGDVVIADASEDYSDIGKAIEIVQVRENSLVAGLHTFIARPKGNVIALGFAGYLLRSPKMRKQIIRIAQGISVLGLSKRYLEKLVLDIPHTDEQRRIADFLTAFHEAIDEKIALISDDLRNGLASKKT
jgi:restriction endonuclease S subunit